MIRLAVGSIIEQPIQSTVTELQGLFYRGMNGGCVGQIQPDGSQSLGLQACYIIRVSCRGDDTETFLLQAQGCVITDAAGTTGDENKTRHNGFSVTRENQYRPGLRPEKTVDPLNQSRSVNEGSDRWRKMAGMRTASTPSMLISMAGMWASSRATEVV